MQIEEFFVPKPTSSNPYDPTQLSCLRWWDSDSPRFVLAIVHGLGEHARRYRHVAEYFVGKGGVVVGIDQQGHGRTAGPLPHISVLVEDIGRLEQHLRATYSDLPLFLYGQSLGGCVVTNYILQHTNHLAGAIATSPLLRTTFPPPAWKVTIAKLLGKYWPNLTLSTAIKPKELSRDPEAVAAYINDPEVHQRVSAALGLSMLEAGEWAIQNASRLKTPFLLMHGTSDRITSFDASQEFAKRSNALCRFVPWQGFFHDMHCEPEQQAVFETITRFIEQRINSEFDSASNPLARQE